MIDSTTPNSPNGVTFYADQEHSGLRAAVVIILLVVFVAALLGVNAWLRSLPPGGIGDYWVFVSCVTALPVALAVAAGAEYVLKRTWHSGRSVSLDDQGMKAILASGESRSVDWSKRFGAIKWMFALKGFPRGGRERRVPAGWYCLACQLQQDEERFVIYTYVPPKEVRRWAESGEYFEIVPSDFFDTNAVSRFLKAPERPQLPASLLADKSGIYWLAERRRWSEGLELTRHDFATVVEQVERYEESY